MPTTPVCEQDVDEVSTPIHSPRTPEWSLCETHTFHFSSPTPLYGEEDLGSPFIQTQSSYSSLKGWAGDHASKRTCANSYMSTRPPLQDPFIYDPDPVMKDAFAAATIPYHDWSIGFGSPTAPLSLQYPDRSRGDLESLQFYTQGLQAAGYYDNRCQLF